MWTPKRILLTSLGVVVFLGSYVVYANRLGGIDGLPALPEKYLPKPGPVPPPPARGKSITIIKLEQAFGKDCDEAKPKRPIKIEVPARGMILSAGDFKIEDDGRVKLWPLSVALFGKAKGEDGITPEINTIRGDLAYVTFERPIQTIQDMGKYRIIASQIAGHIRIVNNRRTKARDDDVSVYIANGPLFYLQKEQRIWTDDFVRVVDDASKPMPTVITGQGMVLDLVAEAPPVKPGGHVKKQQFDNITGVKRIRLLSAVDMLLFVDAHSGFLNSPTPGAKKPAATAPTAGNKAAGQPEPEKTQLVIKTHGPFDYDMQKDFARFDIPQAKRGATPALPEQVTVIRGNQPLPDRRDPLLASPKLDQLVCEHLELQFRKKEAPATVARPRGERPKAKKEAPADRSSNLEIETAHATGKQVTLASDAESLDAYGNDFTYNALTLLTILKGQPTEAIKEGSRIFSRELHILGNREGKGQTATAYGPNGKLDLFDKTTGKTPRHAYWTKTLVSSKESTREGDFDVLHLTQDAAFVDEENGQELRADEIYVWLESKDDKNGKDGKGAAKSAAQARSASKSADANQGEQARRPHHVLALGHVIAVSREFNVRNATRFEVWFKDAPPGSLPPAKASGPATTVAATTPPTAGGPKPIPARTAPNTPAAVTTAPGQKPAEEPRKPINLSASTVEARVLRYGERSQLEDLKAGGAVDVTQAPSKPGEKGTHITGEKLHLIAQPDGNWLEVIGDPSDLARLEMDKMVILGPIVTIDQPTNKAWVDGIGVMTMESDTDFEGKKLTKMVDGKKVATTVPITIHWNRSMFFNGTFAEFHGGIQADQENSRLACHALQVFFDKPISLKETDHSSEKARIRNLVADKEARVEDSTFEKNEPVRFQRLYGRAIAHDNEVGLVQASGPGTVRIIQKGSTTATEGQAGAAPAAARPGTSKNKGKDDDGLKMTYVTYERRMYGDKKNNLAQFYGNVRVLYKPVEKMDDAQKEVVDLDRLFEKPLPEGGMYLRCQQLKVRQRPPRKVRNAQGQEVMKAYQEMNAFGQVSIQSAEFNGSAPRVTYDEEKDQVIFDGGPSGMATLYKVKPDGSSPEQIEGRKIIYSRSTGQHTGEGINTIIGH